MQSIFISRPMRRGRLGNQELHDTKCRINRSCLRACAWRLQRQNDGLSAVLQWLQLACTGSVGSLAEQVNLAAVHATIFSALPVTTEGVEMNASKPAVCVRVLLSLFFVTSVNAQCRIGSGPNHGDGVPYCSQLTPPPKTSLGPRWAVQWGAIAYGGGGFGAAKQMSSVAEAKNSALRACRDSGGSNHCKVGLSYSDQCVAYAIGDDY